jgi:hypothetical protein
LTVSDEVPGVDVHAVAFIEVVMVVVCDVVVEVVLDVVWDELEAVEVDEVEVDVVWDELEAVEVDEVEVVIVAATHEVAMVLLSMVTVPVFAKAAPCRVAPVASVTLE